MRSGRRRRWLRQGWRIGLAGLVGVLLLEGVVRALGLGGTTLTRGALHRYDPDAGWTCARDLDARYTKPGSFDVRVRTTSRGLRDRPHALDNPGRRRRVLCLGDSTMWGYGVENDEMFSAQLEAALPGWEAINLGVNGYSTVQELIRFERDGRPYRPDRVVLAFCWNDLEDNLDDKDGGRPVARLGADGAVRIVNRPVRRHWKSPVKQWFRRHSRLFSFVEYRLAVFKARRREMKAVRRRTGRASLTPAGGGGVVLSRLDVYGRPAPAVERAWAIEEALIVRLRDLARGVSSRLLVVYVASREEVDRETFTRQVEALAPRGGTGALDWDRPARRLGAIAARLGLPYVNLLPAFRAAPRPTALFLPRNYHWNAAGHRLAAQHVARKLGVRSQAPSSHIRRK